MSDRVGLIALGFFCLMGASVLTYLFITGAFLSGDSLTAWTSVLEAPLADYGIEVENFALFIVIGMIFVFGFLLPILLFVVRSQA